LGTSDNLFNLLPLGIIGSSEGGKLDLDDIPSGLRSGIAGIKNIGCLRIMIPSRPLCFGVSGTSSKEDEEEDEDDDDDDEKRVEGDMFDVCQC